MDDFDQNYIADFGVPLGYPYKSVNIILIFHYTSPTPFVRMMKASLGLETNNSDCNLFYRENFHIFKEPLVLFSRRAERNWICSTKMEAGSCLYCVEKRVVQNFDFFVSFVLPFLDNDSFATILASLMSVISFI